MGGVFVGLVYYCLIRWVHVINCILCIWNLSLVVLFKLPGEHFVSASRSGYGGPQGSYALRSLCDGDQETDHENERLVCNSLV